MLLKAHLEQARRSLAGVVSFPARSAQTLVAPFSIQSAATEDASLGDREFLGLAAVYGNTFVRFDRAAFAVVPTVLEPGCFAKSISAINSRPGDRAGKIPLLWEHYELLGRTLTLADTPEGVRCRCRVTDEQQALSRYAYIKDGSADGMSIGFTILASTKVTSDGEEVEHVTEGELHEVTACLWGANPLAGIEQAASYVPQVAAGKVLRKELKARADCAAGDLAHILSAASKAAEEDEDGEEQVSRTWLLRELERLNLRIDTLAAELGRKE